MCVKIISALFIILELPKNTEVRECPSPAAALQRVTLGASPLEFRECSSDHPPNSHMTQVLFKAQSC